MQDRVHEILLVSSIYESFILEEDGQLDEGLITEYQYLGLVTPAAAEARGQRRGGAREDVRDTKGPDLIITTAQWETWPRPSSCGGSGRLGLDTRSSS